MSVPYFLQRDPDPDFQEIEKVLKRKPSSRPVLFEFFMNDDVYSAATEELRLPEDERIRPAVKQVLAFWRLGYDYATLTTVPGYAFKTWEQEAKTISLNSDPLVTDWKSFETFKWPSLEDADIDIIEEIEHYIPEGMKLIASGPGGVEENVISLTGYENLCYMMADDGKLAGAIFDEVGKRINSYYAEICKFDCIGAVISNDDWGFKTQTLLSEDQMEKYLYSWHLEITKTIHHSGCPAILHSCGRLSPVMDIIIDDLQYDAKHSFEDEIQPVEEAYEEYAHRIAILGGIDLDFICQKTPEEVYRRSKAMLERTAGRGGYALGTGNSVPDYVPRENYFAMLQAARE